MPVETYNAKSGVPPPYKGIYSHVARAGNLVYTSGSVGMHEGGQMAEGTVQDRTRVVIQNLEIFLQAAGLGLKDVVKANIYLSNLAEDFDKVNEVYDELMPNPKPARTCVGVAQLPAGGTDVEIEFVAYDENYGKK